MWVPWQWLRQQKKLYGHQTAQNKREMKKWDKEYLDWQWRMNHGKVEKWKPSCSDEWRLDCSDNHGDKKGVYETQWIFKQGVNQVVQQVNQVEQKAQVEEEEQVENELDQGGQGLGTHQEVQQCHQN